ncbi:hypothetical protein ACJX0J_015864, partial [Zea mays]
QVSGTCTTVTTKRELEMLGMNASVFDGTEDSLENIHSLRQATHLLISIPPIPGVGDPLLINLDEDLRRILGHGNLEWLCYLSSTSVYGDCGGVLVDEDHTVNPKSESAKLRYNAEKGWLNLIDDPKLSAFVFRLGGIYGPGRSALDTLAKSKSLSRKQKLRESKQYTARIHVADIYQAVLASMSIRCARKIFNVPAGLDYQEMIVPAEKRVSNARMKQELGVYVSVFIFMLLNVMGERNTYYIVVIYSYLNVMGELKFLIYFLPLKYKTFLVNLFGTSTIENQVGHVLISIFKNVKQDSIGTA